jgi:hypothetical protein
MQKIFRLLRQKFYKWTERKMQLPLRNDVPTERLGTPYGGWIIPANLLNNNSVCYLVGAGEDVSFDLALAARFGCPAHIFDPTPRAQAHVELLIANLKSGQKTACATAPDGFYPACPPEVADLLLLHPVGIWDKDETLRFFSPKDEAHVSHSIVNLQQTDHYIEVPVRRLAGLMPELGHTRIDLLKIDIEGAEYQVLESLHKDSIFPGALCIEFDESYANHFDAKYMDRIENALQKLLAAGYHIIGKEAHCHNYTLIHQSYLPQ